ncbi:hypothetical protein TRICI_004686 [Trichomonascus ciferrii]|uniref:Dynamitin domain-containing protein n=1 Tax=Trichomonascus ciferrii TaxID=44093 RepID=A0A642UZN5_9ASCO|nr:hypothetical protein TRICI_004686 [Trichomonascus ciferrii]
MTKEQAAQVFETKDVDVSKADFSDNITNSPANSYRVKTIPETLDARIARLQREVEEVKILKKKETGEDASRMDELKSILDSLSSKGRGYDDENADQLHLYEGMGERRLADKTKMQLELTNRLLERYLNRFTDLETRLTKVEEKIGATNIKRPILPSIDELRNRINLVSNTPSGLEKAVANLKDLAIAVEKLKTAKQRPTSASAQQQQEVAVRDEEIDMKKVNEIYQRLPLVDNLSALVPVLIARLKSLQGIHADAEVSTEAMRDIDHTIQTIASEFKQWTETLHTVETKLREMDNKMKQNRQEISEWVQNMETRISKLTPDE